jgi:CHAT domain-containing protein
VSSCREFEEAHFLPLPATRTEAQEVLALWHNGDERLLEGTGATEGAFKREAPGRRVVHAATHGFFLREDCTHRLAGEEASYENPLLLSGLVFAGANRRASTDSLSEDGILTAEEVSSLALDGTEWVVLSACNSGVGAIVSGEGVLGLRRAFQLAGARTVITSLWPVNDRAARRWMRSLYEAHLRDGRPTDDAVREATRRLLAERRAAGADTNPATWAAFVAVGDWR